MKRLMALLFLLMVIAIPISVSAQFDDVIIGVTDSSMIANDALEYYLLNNGICKTVKYIIVDLEEAKNVPLDLLILSDSEYLQAAESNTVQNLYSYFDADAFYHVFSKDMLASCEISNLLYGIPRSITQEFFLWDITSASSLSLTKPNVNWTWEDAYTILKSPEIDVQNHYYGMYGMQHKLLCGFRSEMLETLLVRSASCGVVSEEDLELGLRLFKEIHLSNSLLNSYPSQQDIVVLQDMGQFSRSEYPFIIQEFFLPSPLVSSSIPYRNGHFTFYCIPSSCRSISFSKQLLKNLFSTEYRCYVDQDISLWLSSFPPSYIVESNVTSDVNDDTYIKIVDTTCLSFYNIKAFHELDAYSWYLRSKDGCLPSLKIMTSSNFQSMISILASFCNDQITIDTAQSLLKALFLEVITNE
jgi:hypothetical protein